MWRTHMWDELRQLNGNLAITEAGQRRVFYQQQLFLASVTL